MPQESDGSCSEVIQESGEFFNCQEIISDYEMYKNDHDDQNLKSMQLKKDLIFLLVFMENLIV